jgi:hypothetical protein
MNSKKQVLKSAWILSVLVLAFVGCQKAPTKNTEKPPVPTNWVIGSENESETETVRAVTDGTEGDDDQLSDAEAPTLADTTQELFNTQASSLNALPTPAKAPWRLSAVMTDLTISASGWLGFLVQKGSPAVTTIWRKQYSGSPPAVSSPAALVADETIPAADLQVGPESTPGDIERDLEPSVQALLATGTIKGETNLRRNLLAAAQDFQNTTILLASVKPKGQWWVSRFRLDFVVDVSGNVTPAVGIGAEARVRFEWHRLRPKASPAPTPKTLVAFSRTPGLAENLVGFAGNLADDLSEIADGSAVSAKGFRAYTYRVGLGISAKGNVGVAKAAGTLTGHLYFSRDVTKPVVHPKPSEGGATMNLISDAGPQNVIPIDRQAFRRGLRKALRIGRFFARHADKARGKWKIHELRTAFDLSFGGKTGVVTVGGVAATEISFYNLKF